MMGAPRIAPVPPGTRPELADIEQRIVAQRGRISPLYQVLLNSAPLAAGWEQLLTAVRNQSSVPADLRELVILRVAVLNRAAFEFDAHAPIALREGVPQAKVDAVRQPDLAALFDERERRVLQLTDTMTRDIEVPDALMAELKREHGDRTLLELVATVAAYNMVSRLLVALHVGH